MAISVTAAKAFFEKNGHLSIPKTYVSDSGKSVGRWILAQRANRKQGKLTDRQVRMLDEIGMAWNMEKPAVSTSYQAVLTGVRG